MALPKKITRTWYADGLAFECLECGGCCSGPEEGYVWITREECVTAAKSLDLTPREFHERYCRRVGGRISLIEQPNADCIFLLPDESGVKHCAVYTVRPSQCRTWPFWRANLTRPGDWALAGTRCPGINRGSLHDLEHIEQRKADTGD